MIASSRNYAIGMVHFKIGGGWLVTGIILAVYLVLFFGVLALIFYADYRNPGLVLRDIGRGLLGLLMALQGLALLGVGGYRVSAAIRSDISSRMLESHRLMPITSSRAVLGYLFGPPTPTVAFVLLNLLLSLAFGNWMGGDMERLVINQLVMFTFAVFAWGAIGLGTFIYRHIFIIGFSVMILTLCMQTTVRAYNVLPAASLLYTPFLGESVFMLGRGFGVSPPLPYDLYAIGLGGQVALFALFFMGSCRLYRGTYATAFSARQALALLITWGILSALGIGHSDQLGFNEMFRGVAEFDDEVGMVQIVGSVITCVLIAMVPLWSVMRGQAKDRSPVMQVAIVLVLAVAATLPVAGASWMHNFGVRAIAVTFLIVLTQIVIVYGLMRMVRNLQFILAALVIVGAMFAVNLGPVILEMIRLNMVEDRVTRVSLLMTLSPMGLVGTEWTRDFGGMHLSPVLGCVWQVLLAAATMGLSALVTRRKPKGEAVVAFAGGAAPVAVPPVVMPVGSGPSSGGTGLGPV